MLFFSVRSMVTEGFLQAVRGEVGGLVGDDALRGQGIEIGKDAGDGAGIGQGGFGGGDLPLVRAAAREGDGRSVLLRDGERGDGGGRDLDDGRSGRTEAGVGGVLRCEDQ